MHNLWRFIWTNIIISRNLNVQYAIRHSDGNNYYKCIWKGIKTKKSKLYIQLSVWHIEYIVLFNCYFTYCLFCIPISYICSEYLTESGCDAAFFTYNLLKIHIQTKHKKDSNNKRKILSSKKYVVEIEDKSYEIFDIDEDSSTQVKRPRVTSVIRINNDEFEQDALELALEKELDSQEQKSDNEYETICDWLQSHIVASEYLHKIIISM